MCHYNFGLKKFWNAENSWQKHNGDDVFDDPTPWVHPLRGIVILNGLWNGQKSFQGKDYRGKDTGHNGDALEL